MAFSIICRTSLTVMDAQRTMTFFSRAAGLVKLEIVQEKRDMEVVSYALNTPVISLKNFILKILQPGLTLKK